MNRKVTKKGDRVEILYTDDKGNVVAHESLSLETYKENYPQELDKKVEE